MTRSDGDPIEDQTTTASMADLKSMETSLISSMDTKFAEMRELITQLASGKVAKETPPPLDESATSNDGETEEGKGEKQGVEDKETDPKKSSTSTTTPEGGKPEYHGVPFAYSPDPPIDRKSVV